MLSFGSKFRDVSSAMMVDMTQDNTVVVLSVGHSTIRRKGRIQYFKGFSSFLMRYATTTDFKSLMTQHLITDLCSSTVTLNTSVTSTSPEFVCVTGWLPLCWLYSRHSDCLSSSFLYQANVEAPSLNNHCRVVRFRKFTQTPSSTIHQKWSRRDFRDDRRA